jgi:hypothetical protein
MVGYTRSGKSCRDILRMTIEGATGLANFFQLHQTEAGVRECITIRR